MRYTKNQKLFMTNGALWSGYKNLAIVFLPAFALLLGATNTYIGLLAALPWIAMLIAEIPGAKLIEFFPRKKIIISIGLISRLSWLGVIFAPWLWSKNPLLLVAVFVFIRWLTEYLKDPAWTSLMADIVPTRIRGRFFANRLWLMALVGVIATLGGGYLLRATEGTAKHFAWLLGASVVLGLLAHYFLSKIKAPPYQDHRHHPLHEFFKPPGKLRQFIIFDGFLAFAVYIASPFFAVYQLKVLGLDYGTYALAAVLPSIAALFVQKRWGRLTDRYGDKPIAVLGVIGVALFPLIYLFITPDRVWLIWPAAILGGISWAGVHLATFNLMLDLSPSETRAVHISQYKFYMAIPHITAPLIGGWLSQQQFPIDGLLFVFAASAALRVTSLALLHLIEEPRARHIYPLKHVIRSAISFHPERLEYRMRATLHKIERGVGNEIQKFKKDLRTFD